ncbi:MAG: hypothetical protein KKA16_04690 [Alphaproteobacteria bacterium]|nr:hypothetical protein [Alphaproteobacteria bacterium]MBU2380461.1 hypothetical protein [Alphaproteobacteria bacterium]
MTDLDFTSSQHSNSDNSASDFNSNYDLQIFSLRALRQDADALIELIRRNLSRPDAIDGDPPVLLRGGDARRRVWRAMGLDHPVTVR